MRQKLVNSMEEKKLWTNAKETRSVGKGSLRQQIKFAKKSEWGGDMNEQTENLGEMK
jgi:hypothetical protein